MITTLFSYLGAIGFGGISGILIKHFLDKDFEKRKLLFEARAKAYGQLIGKIRNLFLPDLLEKDSHMRSYEFNIILSETRLLSSKYLYKALLEYGRMVGDHYDEIEKENNGEANISEENISILKNKGSEIIELMRKDLYLID